MQSNVHESARGVDGVLIRAVCVGRLLLAALLACLGVLGAASTAGAAGAARVPAADAAADRRPLTVLATQILKDSSAELQRILESKLHTPVRIEIGSTAALVARLDGGEVADVALLTEEPLEKLVAKRVTERPVTLLVSELGIAVADESTPPKLDSAGALATYLKSVPSIAIASQAASGAHVLKLLDQYGIAASVKPRLVLVKEGLTGTLVTQGKAVAAIQQVSELRSAGLKNVVPLPQDAQLQTLVGGAVLKRSPNIEGARRALAILGSPEAFAEYTRAGLKPVAASATSANEDQIRKSLAPTGVLRAAINYNNAVLAQRDADTGKLSGMAVDLTNELGRRMGLPVKLLPYESAGALGTDAASDKWDIAYLAVDPERAKTIDFSPPYVLIEGSYLVPAGSHFERNEQLDADGTRIAVTRKSAYDLYLSRALQHAQLVRADNTPASIEMFLAQHLDAVAAVRSILVERAKTTPGVRVLRGHFMTIPQAAGVPAGRPLAASYLQGFIEEMKSSGFVDAALKREGLGPNDALVAPPKARSEGVVQR